MSDFGLYLNWGFKHIANLKAIDHILFVAAVSLRYQFKDWKKLLVLIATFTIGHTLTLLLSFVNLIRFSQVWIEFLIPVTILIADVSNLFVQKSAAKSKYPFIYFVALFFGLIHGLGISSYLKRTDGSNASVFFRLLAFTVGIEVGQLIIAVAVLLITLVCLLLLKLNKREYLLFVSGGIFAVALHMAITRYPL